VVVNRKREFEDEFCRGDYKIKTHRWRTGYAGNC
jgi:hypothetical protein